VTIGAFRPGHVNAVNPGDAFPFLFPAVTAGRSFVLDGNEIAAVLVASLDFTRQLLGLFRRQGAGAARCERRRPPSRER
jgi:hypothetical protein